MYNPKPFRHRNVDAFAQAERAKGDASIPTQTATRGPWPLATINQTTGDLASCRLEKLWLRLPTAVPIWKGAENCTEMALRMSAGKR